MDQRWRWCCQKKKAKKKVNFADDEDEKKDTGGAIRGARGSEVAVHTRRIEYKDPLAQPVDDDRLRSRKDDDTDTDTDDEDEGLYSHLGGKITGRGMAYDPPEVRNMMMDTFAQHPEVLATYIQGRVVNPTYEDPHPVQRDSRADLIDFGGSMNSISHVVNGRAVAYNSYVPTEFHIS